MSFGKFKKRTQGPKTHETVDEYLKRGGVITKLPAKTITDWNDYNPCRPKGSSISLFFTGHYDCWPTGCLRVPQHGGG